jgi:predicted NAD-dependent protein-ADP-ribosyltransferase YbiA (DUF1768 family)
MILRNEDLINKLGQREVVNETNLLHKIDGRKFGVSGGKGKNMLGRILMDLRKEYKEET